MRMMAEKMQKICLNLWVTIQNLLAVDSTLQKHCEARWQRQESKCTTAQQSASSKNWNKDANNVSSDEDEVEDACSLRACHAALLNIVSKPQY